MVIPVVTDDATLSSSPRPQCLRDSNHRCLLRNYNLFASCIVGQFASECWCGSGTPAQTYELYGRLPDSACDSECTGAGPEGEACGGAFKMSVYAYSA